MRFVPSVKGILVGRCRSGLPVYYNTCTKCYKQNSSGFVIEDFADSEQQEFWCSRCARKLAVRIIVTLNTKKFLRAGKKKT